MIPIKILLAVILAMWVGMQIGRLVMLWELEETEGKEEQQCPKK